MEQITTKEKYDEKVENFKSVYDDQSIPLEEKIRLCEEFAYCDYVKGSDSIAFSGELAEMYLKAGRYQDVINFINIEFKTHFKDDSDWWMFIAGMLPFYTFYVIDAYIALKDYNMAKGVLEALKMNRAKMLEMHPDDGFTTESKFWYARVITKYAQIAILQNDASTALDYLVNDPIFEDTKTLGSYYYMGIISKGDINANLKEISLAINCFINLCELDVNSDSYVEEEVNMIISSNYYLGLIYATENGYKNKEKAITYLTKAKDLGYSITNEEIQNMTDNIIDSTPSVQKNSNDKSGGCYVATCVYGSYDCPPVWTLRRFRDNTLSQNLFGRMFIRVYYAASPTIVKMFGKYEWFHNMWRKPLDRLVSKLQKMGMESTPYKDKN